MSIRSRLTRILQEKIDHYYLVKRYSEFLGKGLYSERNGEYKKSVIGFPVVFKNTPEHDLLCVMDNSSFAPQKSVKIIRGGWSRKIICLYNDVVVSYYSSSREQWFDNVQQYIDKIPYPKSRYILIDKSKHIIICERVLGKDIIDLEHAAICAEEMLSCMALKYKLNDYFQDICYEQYEKTLNKHGISKFFSCVQHGDASIHNVLWLDDNNFKFIDLDTISVQPLLYDFFRLILTDFKKPGLKLYIDGRFDNRIKKIFATFHKEFDTAQKDLYLAIFFVFSNGRWQDFWSDYPFDKSYPLTQSVIKDLKGK